MTLQEKIDNDIPLTDDEHEQFLDMMTAECMGMLFSDPNTSSLKVYREKEIRESIDDYVLGSPIIH